MMGRIFVVLLIVGLMAIMLFLVSPGVEASTDSTTGGYYGEKLR